MLYVCENNQWQAFVHRRETMVGDHIAPWAASYGMDSLVVDGNDVEAVLEAATRAAAQVRATRRPFLLEAWTYRQRGHMEPRAQARAAMDSAAAFALDSPYPDPSELTADVYA